MEYLRRLFGMTPSSPVAADLAPFMVTFSNGKSARAVRTSHTGDPQEAIYALGLAQPRPSLIVTGGAGNMDQQTSLATRSIIEDGLARFAHENALTVVDGGTNSGVMALLGTARARRGYTFPLVGVAPEAMVEYPDHANPDKQADMDANHSHFVFTTGAQWGDESNMLAGLGWSVTGSGKYPALNFVINGGEIVKNEVYARATGALKLPILILEGSGRFADALAETRKRKSDDIKLNETLAKGEVYFVSLSAGADHLYQWLENFYHL
jgi:hypothetical protein